MEVCSVNFFNRDEKSGNSGGGLSLNRINRLMSLLVKGSPKSRAEALARAQTFTVYYGHGEEERLKAYDLVIVEPAGHSRERIAELRDSGTLVLAYVSFMEVRPDDPVHQQIGEFDWLKVDGSIVMNSGFNNRLLDLTSGTWAALLQERIRGLLHREGYDGVFIDTVGNVEWPTLPLSVRRIQTEAAADRIREIKSLFPDHLLIQNNGINELCYHTSNWIDALCWENPCFLEPHAAWAQSVARGLSRLTSRGKALRALLLYEESPEAAASLQAARYYASKYGWMVARCPKNYL